MTNEARLEFETIKSETICKSEISKTSMSERQAALDVLFHAVQRHGLSHEWEAYKTIRAALSSPASTDEQRKAALPRYKLNYKGIMEPSLDGFWTPWELANTAPQPIDAWLPIETAPRDGTEILVFKDIATVPVVHIARFEKADEMFYDDDPDKSDGWWSYTHNSVGQEMLVGYKYPTHWMPLPKPPEDR